MLFKKKKRTFSGKYVRDLGYAGLLPRTGYMFYSDYFKYDNRYAVILTMIVDSNGAHNLRPFWRLNLIPDITQLNDINEEGGLHGIRAELLEGYINRPKNWITAAQSKAAWISGQEWGESGADSTEVHGQSVVSRLTDLQQISFDLGRESQDGYADWSVRVLISANSIDDLDAAVLRYRQNIANNKSLGGVHFVPYEGQQGIEMQDLLKSARDQLGSPSAKLMGTSSEYAGGYDLVTQGITDRNGDYIGRMLGDVNSTAVLLDIDNYDDHVVIAHNAPATMVNIEPDMFDAHTRSSTLLGVRLAQAAMINNKRVVHFVLNDAKPQNIGADLSDITTIVPLNRGAINPFEIFGTPRTELADYASYKKKMGLMTQEIQLSQGQVKLDLTSTDLNSTLSDILDDFYKDNEMLVDNPENNRERLKLVKLPHDQYPKLEDFMVYLNTAYDEAIEAQDMALAASVNRVRAAFKVMNSDNRDLFNIHTDDSVDNAQRAAQVVYTFSGLSVRGRGVEMAQFVNSLHYATQQLAERDVVIIHGCDQITDDVKEYIDDVLTALRLRGIRVVYLYDDLEKCLHDFKFNHFRDVDYRMLGGFNSALVNDFTSITQEALPGNVADTLSSLSKTPVGKLVYYLNRRMDNIIFALDMNLGMRGDGLLSENPKGLMESSLDKTK